MSPTPIRRPEPGETLHRVVTDCPGLWGELDDEEKADWAEGEAEVVMAAVLKEREACAQVYLGCQISETSLSAEWGRQCAAAIRRTDESAHRRDQGIRG